ncbi:hypothetical protein [Streptomyces anulatus]|nr:hypothetical protein [Streptomyces anulatus]NED28177.1 hypothetical protein [Streptomyces anulatus]
MGKQLSPASRSADGQMPYLRVANVFEGRIDYRNVHSMGFTHAEKAAYSLRPGDILLNEGQESLANVGRSAVYDGQRDSFCFQNTLIRFRAGGKVLPEYAQAVFVDWRRMGAFARVAEKTSISHLGGSRFAKMMFPLISRRRQLEIVQVLSSFAEAQEAAVEEIAKLRAIRDIVTGRLDSYERMPFGEVIVDGPRNGIYKPEGEYCDAGVPIVRISSFEGGPSDLSHGLLRVKASDAEVRRYGVSAGDVLINRVNTPGLVGKSTVVDRIAEPTMFESNIMRCRIRLTEVKPKVIEAWLSGPVARAHFSMRTKPAISQASINRSDVLSCPIPRIDPSVQVEFIGRLEAVDSAISCSQARLGKLMHMQKGAMAGLLGSGVMAGVEK